MVDIDLTEGPKGEKFEYKGHNCRVTYNGIRPGFFVDGSNVPLHKVEEVSGHAGRGPRAWKKSLKEYIDETF